MKRFLSGLSLFGVMALLLAAGASAGELTRTFEKKDQIRISLVSGSCVVEAADVDEIRVMLEHRYHPRDSFEPIMRERGDVLFLEEEIHGSNSGESTWTLQVPRDTEIDFSSASGDLTVHGLRAEVQASIASGDIEAEDCTGEFRLVTASGDVRMSRCSGDFELSAASGDVVADDCHGSFELSTASGDVRAQQVVIDGPSSFSTASGDADVKLGESPDFDLEVSSASGDATLDFQGHPVKGSFEMVCKLRSGRIESPFEFEHESKFRGDGDDGRYIRKEFTREQDSPHVLIRTASGTAALIDG